MVEKTKKDGQIGSERDVELTANLISPREITALTIAGEPFEDRREALLKLIDELRIRIESSERGEDLKPLLRDAKNALESLDPESEEG